jgi:hypothetical protein
LNLQEFISQALIQIASGVRDADEELRSSSAVVNPRHVAGAGADKSNVYGYIADTGKKYLRAVHTVEFDIAVTAVDGKETKGGIGIVVGAIGLGSQGRSEERNTSISRIKFKVPIAFPNSKEETQ